MSNSYLALNHVSARHGRNDDDTVHDISLHVAAGEVIGVLGSSGSGKTTLLRIIAGLHVASEGSVILDGVDITTTPTHLRGVGLMFQEHALFPHLTVSDNVAFGLRMAKVPKAERSIRVAEVLELVGLTGFGARDVASLSGGERQRVALARTLAPSPRLLLLDEPMGSLDRVLRDRLVAELRELIGVLGLTALYVTHDRSEAFALADRIAVLDGGAVVQIDTPVVLDACPTTEHVARLLGHR
jgi:ABC-type Fe3+/spermidine/putrescine transport system ATPase subunit